MENSIACRIWAEEVSHEGFRHRCHAESLRLDGNPYLRDEISQVLKTKLTWDKDGRWELVACKPDNHCGIECDDCRYKHARGLSKYFDTKKQVQALQEVRFRF